MQSVGIFCANGESSIGDVIYLFDELIMSVISDSFEYELVSQFGF
jgi:hypothetical protein